MGTKKQYSLIVAPIAMMFAAGAIAQPTGLEPRIGERLTQAQIENELNLLEIRREGLRMFTTPFNLADGYGDGVFRPGIDDGVTFGQRPGLQNAGQVFLRMNGLDSQTCLECHSIVSNATIPATFGVGGVGGASSFAFPGIIDPDIDDSEGNGFARIVGRAINPPFNFGTGGVEALAKEMTKDLQALKAEARANPGTIVDLTTKGVNFGSIAFIGGDFDTSNVEGINDDLVVRPFGRKGENSTVRDFDINALRFHQGMEVAEMFGDRAAFLNNPSLGKGVLEDPNADGDQDGVSNEITAGELSAMHIFQVTLEPPVQVGTFRERRGAKLFDAIGCTACHKPSLTTDSRYLNISFPEVPTDPDLFTFISIDLAAPPLKFDRVRGGGVEVPLFADLKRHDMGPRLAESTGGELDRFFTTARLWGVADTAPYLHDGRAQTIPEAILFHGGEAQGQRDRFAALNSFQQQAILDFLGTLRTPRDTSTDILPRGRGRH